MELHYLTGALRKEAQLLLRAERPNGFSGLTAPTHLVQAPDSYTCLQQVH